MTLLEVCVDSDESLARAVESGAGRLEVCSRLDVGGLTPTAELMTAALASGLPCVAMVRPRAGSFMYTPSEARTLRDDLDRMKSHGAHAIVTGALTETRTIDRDLVADLVARARPLPLVFHRAFDDVDDQYKALETLIELGVTRILTSGAGCDAYAGRFRLRELVLQARGRIAILPGGGVRGWNAEEIVAVSGASELHSSTPF